MKKIFRVVAALLAVAAVFAAGFFCAGAAAPEPALPAGVYPQTAVVWALEEETDTVWVCTAGGFLYGFPGIEDYCEGDLVSLIMHDSGTEYIMDDEVLAARYAGFFKDEVEYVEAVEFRPF